jgi:hypothetical protein
LASLLEQELKCSHLHLQTYDACSVPKGNNTKLPSEKEQFYRDKIEIVLDVAVLKLYDEVAFVVMNEDT